MTTAQWQAWELANTPTVGSTGGSSAHATMRYYHHKAVGKMTTAQWQAWQLAHSAGGTSAASTAFVAPSQTVAAQARMAELANTLQTAQNSGNVAAQQKALNAELKLEKLWLSEDKKRLAQLNSTLKNRSLSSKSRAQLQQNRLTILQEIGNVAGSIGSAMSSLSSLTGAGSTGSFDLAPTGAAIQMPTLYDVRSAIGARRGGRAAGLHKGITAPSHHTSHNTIKLYISKDVDMKKFADAFADVTGAQLTGELQAAGLI
jgi:hypothetical protein